jgi:hypothetical protein
VIASWLTAHSQYFFWVVYVAGGGLITWRYAPLTLVRLVGAFTTNPQRHRQCAEILRLARKDAASIPSYVSELPPPSDSAKSPTTGKARSRHRSRVRSKHINDAAKPETSPRQSRPSETGRRPIATAGGNAGTTRHRPVR